METDIRVFDVVDSTNTVIGQMAEDGADEGTCVVSFEQRCGQGRSGRSFFSPPGGNLYMSFLLRPQPDAVDMLTVAAAVSVVEAVRDVFHIDTGIKWVNDIIYNGRKVCGIIAKATNVASDDMYVTVGIGINIYESENVQDEIRERYGTLTGQAYCGDKKSAEEQSLKLARKILGIFFEYYENGFENVIDRYRQYSVIIGRIVEYIEGDRIRTAKVCGIGDDGAVALEENGYIRSYRDGEIRIRTADNIAL